MDESTPSTRCPCEVRTLARRGIVHVQHCAHCRCVSLNLGAVTVRLEESALDVVVDTLTAAADALEDRAPQGVVQPRGYA